MCRLIQATLIRSGQKRVEGRSHSLKKPRPRWVGHVSTRSPFHSTKKIRSSTSDRHPRTHRAENNGSITTINSSRVRKVLVVNNPIQHVFPIDLFHKCENLLHALPQRAISFTKKAALLITKPSFTSFAPTFFSQISIVPKSTTQAFASAISTSFAQFGKKLSHSNPSCWSQSRSRETLATTICRTAGWRVTLVLASCPSHPHSTTQYYALRGQPRCSTARTLIRQTNSRWLHAQTFDESYHSSGANKSRKIHQLQRENEHSQSNKRRYGATQLRASYVFVIPRRNFGQFVVSLRAVLCVWTFFNVQKWSQKGVWRQQKVLWCKKGKFPTHLQDIVPAVVEARSVNKRCCRSG